MCDIIYYNDLQDKCCSYLEGSPERRKIILAPRTGEGNSSVHSAQETRVPGATFISDIRKSTCRHYLYRGQGRSDLQSLWNLKLGAGPELDKKRGNESTRKNNYKFNFFHFIGLELNM